MVLALVFLANDMLDEIHMVWVNEGEAFDVLNEVESGDEEATRDCAATVYVEALVFDAKSDVSYASLDLVVATEVVLVHLGALFGLLAEVVFLTVMVL